jgi:2-methylisocitrate lyase-like PEP mutase family enzyme
MPHDPGPAFRALHRPGDPFILANVWDAGSAKMMVAMGAQAIATSSAAHAFTLGRPDACVTRDKALAHAAMLVSAVNVPVSGDFEAGYGDSPEAVAETVRLACEAGLAGISIEDVNPATAAPYPLAEAVERFRAAASATRTLPRDFVLVARADGIMTGHYDCDEAIRRLLAFEAAGADCLYAPLPKSWDDLARIVAATRLPVNALVAGPYTARSRAEFAAIGVARLSLGSSLARITHRAIHDAGRAMFDSGDFTPLGLAMPGAAVDGLLGG